MARSYDALVVADGATFDYSMGDASGHLTDLIGGQNTTTETGLTYGVPGLPEAGYTAVTFDGTTSLAQTAAAPNVGRDFADGPLSVELWLLFGDNGVSRIPIDRGHSFGNSWMIQKGSDNTIRLADSSAGTTIVRSAALTDLAGIHHVVATKNGATAKMYLDGVDVSIAGTNVTLTDQTASATTGMTIGRSPGFSFFKGTIYRATGYPLVLTAAQVASHFSAGHAAGLASPAPVLPSNRVGPMALRRRFRHIARVAETVVAGGAAAALAGQIDAVSALPTVVLTTSIKAAGQIDGVSALPTSTITTAIRLNGQIDAVSALPTAGLTTAIRAAGTITAVSNLPTATLTTAILMAGLVAAISGDTGALTTAILLAGNVTAVSGTTGTLMGGSAALGSTVAAVSSSTGALTTSILLAGTVTAQSAASGDLTGGAAFVPPVVVAVAPDPGGMAPAHLRGAMPYPDWTLADDDEAVLLLALIA